MSHDPLSRARPKLKKVFGFVRKCSEVFGTARRHTSRSVFVVAVVIVGVIASVSVGVRVIRRSSENEALDRPEIPPRKRQQSPTQQQVQQIHMRRVVRT